MSDYSEKLKDPRWQKKRLEILERDKFTCQRCSDDESTLNVHHKFYINNLEIWDYPNRLLITLCDNCHKVETQNQNKTDELLLEILHSSFLSESIHELAIGFANLQISANTENTTSMLRWVMQTPKIMDELNNRFIRYCHDNYNSEAIAKRENNG